MVSSTVGSSTIHRLEAALQRRVALDVLAVLVEGGGADALHLAARQGRLEDVGRVDAAVGGAGTDQHVHLVDEEDGLRLLDLVDDLLEPLLELAAVHGARHQRAHVQHDQAPVQQDLGHLSPATRRWARPSTMAVLPTPGSPMSAGLFLVRRDRIWMTRSISFWRPDDRVQGVGRRPER